MLISTRDQVDMLKIVGQRVRGPWVIAQEPPGDIIMLGAHPGRCVIACTGSYDIWLNDLPRGFDVSAEVAAEWISSQSTPGGNA